MKIIIVDDDALVSASLKTIIEATSEIKVIAIGKNGKEAIDLYNKYLPDVLLMDIRMQEMNGIESATYILKNHHDAKILFLTTFSDEEYIINALNIGAKGYIIKQNYDCIVPSLKAVYNNQNVYGSEIMNKIPSLLNSDSKKNNYTNYNLSKKDFDLIVLVSEGLSNKEIAQKLFLSEGTIRNYISTILDKLYLRDRTQLAIFYYTNFK